MKNKLAFALALGFSVVSPAYAGDTDSFAVAGTNPDGSAYSGTATLTELSGTGASGDVFKVVWTIGSATVEGTGMVLGTDRKTLYIGYPMKGGVGVAVFTMNDDNTLTSEWIGAGQPMIGHEAWTPVP